MKPLEFLFALLSQFIRFEPGRLADLKEQAHAWENKQKNGDGFVAKLLNNSAAWYVQVGFAIAFLFSVKSISRWMMAQEEPGLLDPEADYGDDEEMPVHTHRKFQLN